MLRGVFIILFLLAWQASFSQTNYILETKNAKASLNSSGSILSHPANTYGGLEIPKNSGKHTVFTGQLWVGGIDSASGNVYAAAQTYRQSHISWFPGPISNSYSGNYEKVFWATRDQVLDHKANWLNPSYQIPQNILEWPGNGDTSNGEPATMAPFEDLNSNGIYEPILGDYPKVRGASSALIVTNDTRDTANSLPNAPCCMDLDVVTYAFDMSYDEALAENMLFFNYKVSNRSSRTYEEFAYEST